MAVPRSLDVKYRKSWSKLVCFTSSILEIRSTTDTTAAPSFILTMPKGLHSKLILSRDGENSAQIAQAEYKRKEGYRITFPDTGRIEHLRSHDCKGKFWFASPTGTDGSVERFEWRRSRGNEVRQVKAHGCGWKLVRMREDSNLDDHDSQSFTSEKRDSAQQDRKSQALGMSSDGHEVVAVWAGGKCLSMHDVGQLEFLGSGADGSLGDGWAMMVLISSLCVWQKEQRDQATYGAIAA